MRDEDLASVVGVESGARVISDPGRAILNIADRRQEVGGLRGMPGAPEAFSIPRSRTTLWCELIAYAPAAIAIFNHVHETLLIALIAIVIAGEEIAIFREQQ